MELLLEIHRSTAEPRGEHQLWLCQTGHWSQLSEPLPSIHHQEPCLLSAKPRGNFPANSEWRFVEPGCLCSWARRSVCASFPAHSLGFQCCMIENKCPSSNSRREAVKWVAKEKIRSQVQWGLPRYTAPEKLLTPNFFPMIVLLFPYFWTLPFAVFSVASTCFL